MVMGMGRRKNKKDRWLQEAIRRPGRVRRYLKRKYGDEAFTKRGTIKIKYLREALKEAEDPSLKQAIRLAIRLKRGL